MSKEKLVSIKLELQSALEILQVLDAATYGYSEEFAPERVVRLRKVMNELSDKLSQSLIE